MELASCLVHLLKEREKSGMPIQVAVIGTGWYGSGMVHQIAHWPGMEPRVVFSRQSSKAALTLKQAGIDSAHIIEANSSVELKKALSEGQFVAVGSLDLLDDLEGIDVIFESTGEVLIGAQVALKALELGIHLVTVNSEMDATVGVALYHKFKEEGLIYSNTTGDQPGVLMHLVESVKALNFDIIVAGNCKGFLDPHKTPDDIKPFVNPGHNPTMITSFTDGTKQGLELCVLANAADLEPDVRGMHGPKVEKDTIIDSFSKIRNKSGIVEYVLGINGPNQGGGVFVVAKCNGNDRIKEDMEYLKMGSGPEYLFFRDFHLCYFESPNSIAEAILVNRATCAPYYYKADVLTAAKKNLKASEPLDGIGGYTVYGLIDTSSNVISEKLLPVGLSKYAVLTRDISIDTPITYDMVDFPEDNVVLKLRREQESAF